MQTALRMGGREARPEVVMHVTNRPTRAPEGSLSILLPTDSRGCQYRMDQSEVYFDRVYVEHVGRQAKWLTLSGLIIYHCTFLSLRSHDSTRSLDNRLDHDLYGEKSMFSG